MICFILSLFVMYAFANLIAAGMGLIAACERFSDPMPKDPRRVDYVFPGYRFGHWLGERPGKKPDAKTR